MAYPKFLRRLFQNDGAGPLLNKEIVPFAKKVEQSLNTSSGIAEGQIVTVPEYTVGYCNINIYINGVRCTRGDTYSEIGDAGELSTTIKFNDALPAEYSVIAIVG